MKSDVYFVKVHSTDLEGRAAALKKLLSAVSQFLKYERDEFVPLKLTIGDSACVYNLSPELVKQVVTSVKKGGAKPFLFDTSVIYKGERQNAVDPLNLAQSKGFAQSRVGAPFIIADGIFGMDGREWFTGSPEITKIKTPSFIGMVDNLVVLSHVTGHIVSRYAGAIKNVAMGMSCRATKQVQHSSLKPSVLAKKCVACGCCVAICPVSAISLVSGKAFIDSKTCLGCGECICACKFDAININWHEDPAIFCQRMADTAGFILSKFTRKFFINFALDITKECDCISNKSEKMIAANLGILASADILSLEKVTMDLINEEAKPSFPEDTKKIYGQMLEYAAEKGLGNLEYNLINLSF